MTLDIKELNRVLDALGPTITKGNDTPPPENPAELRKAGENEQPYGRGFDFLSQGDSLAIQRKLNRLSWDEKGYLLQKQIEAGEGRGVPLRSWQAAQWGQNETIQRALDTSGGAALIRQDLDPFIVSIF